MCIRISKYYVEKRSDGICRELIRIQAVSLAADSEKIHANSALIFSSLFQSLKSFVNHNIDISKNAFIDMPL